MKLVFAGTPELAAPLLRALDGTNHEVVLVITQPDRPAGRGRRLLPTPVKQAAVRQGLPVVQPVSINRPDVVDRLRALEPAALITFAYGKRLLPRVLDIPTLGCFNIHASLLPKYRGAAPVNHALLNGERETGITIQRMAAAIDTGAVLMQRAVPIGPEETAGELTNRLAALAAEMIGPFLEALAAGTLTATAQDKSQASEAPSLRKADGAVPWRRSAEELHNFVRAMTPWPGAFTFHHRTDSSIGTRLILLRTQAPADAGTGTLHAPVANPGTVVRADDQLLAATGSGYLSVQSVKPSGGRAMDAASFIRGHDVAVGDRFREHA